MVKPTVEKLVNGNADALAESGRAEGRATTTRSD
jgi:hypothetical protein